MSSKNKNLYFLDDLSKYKVASDDPDVRGWEVIDAKDQKIGKVDRLLANKETKRVVYLDVEADQSVIEASEKVYDKPAGDGAHEFLNESGENHFIVPIGMVSVDEENKKVRSTEITHDTFSQTKRVRKGAEIDRDYEILVFDQYLPARREDHVHPEDEEFYERKEFTKTYNKC
jgi:hypothetical protein